MAKDKATTQQEINFDILTKLEAKGIFSVNIPIDWVDRNYIVEETKPIDEVIKEGISFNEVYIQEECDSYGGKALNKEEFGKLIEELKFIHSKMT